jgi:hypothetical protein
VKPIARKDELIVEEVLGEWVVYDKNQKRAHNLNSTMAWIWRHCDGATDVDEMAMQFDQEFGSSGSLDLIRSGIQQLEAANLLVSAPRAAQAMAATAPEMSRRSIVAAGSALAPILASILVPTAAAAKSGQNGQGQNGQGG